MDLLVEIGDPGGTGRELESLYTALVAADHEDVDLARRTAPGQAGAMGLAADALLIAVGSGGAGVALIQAICTWLRSRRSTIRVKISTGSTTVEVDVSSARHPHDVLALLEAAFPTDGPR
ncbi:hypothetical protein Lfu02_33320 [Longispora fulva]|uniref:Uncharacterized protein n=1 Tax=Longispora fulva TaxID=619741 RepID=A0A8J7GYT3_9ACTN|nr:hypothetical protein [Longispora fulva]MBG6141884.1 hypothetical protein [Longispora fulva]GIG58960.1 hypothetical protein Lfu02_33320 [Longispora fulva]